MVFFSSGPSAFTIFLSVQIYSISTITFDWVQRYTFFFIYKSFCYRKFCYTPKNYL